MIRSTTGEGFDRLAAHLTRKAAAIAVATASARRLARRDETARWRRANLLWPLFTRG